MIASVPHARRGRIPTGPRRRHLRRLAPCLLAAVLAAPAMTAPARAQEPVRLNYVNADVRDVIRSLASILGLNVLLTESVPSRRVTYTTPTPVPADQVGAVLEAILQSENLVLVQRGPVAEVFPADRAPAHGPIHIGKELPRPTPVGLITQLVPLQNVRADEAAAILGQVAASGARVQVVPGSNALLITERGAEVARILDLLRHLDVPSQGEGGLRTFVYRLRHARAADLAATLSRLYGFTVPAAGEPGARELIAARSLSANLEQFRRRELEALEERRRAGVPIELQVPGDTAALAAGLVGQTIVVPDPATNALVIRTAPPNYPVLQETIEQLDVRPAQVLLEVLIAEITLDESTTFGIDWAAITDDAEITARRGRQAFGDSALADVDDFLVRVVRLGDIDVRAVLRAIDRDADVRVLSTPHVMALNNETARILVGSEVPFNQSTRTGLDVVVDRIVQYRSVGTQLSIVPTINDDGYVSFRILQEVSELTEVTLESALGAPIIRTREAETSALVGDGQTVVIGGLIGETTDRLESGIPLLKDIPLLGYLFRATSTRRLRTELAIFVTPYVVFTDQDAAELLDRERRRMPRIPPPEDAGPPG